MNKEPEKTTDPIHAKRFDISVQTRNEEKNCLPSPHCLDLSRRYCFSLPPGRTDLLQRYSFPCFTQTIL
jgi:hypothetical protein